MATESRLRLLYISHSLYIQSKHRNDSTSDEAFPGAAGPCARLISYPNDMMMMWQSVATRL